MYIVLMPDTGCQMPDGNNLECRHYRNLPKYDGIDSVITIGQTLSGRYQILAALGAGGMGEVFRAYDQRLSREVAVKLLPDRVRSDEKALSRFEKEAKALAALSHPNILSIYDSGVDQDVSYAITELLRAKLCVNF